MTRPDRILRHLVIGCDGRIGHALLDQLKSRGESVIGTTRRKSKSTDQYHLDLKQPSDIAPLSRMADVAYFCAGNTSILQCERQSKETRRINVEALRYITAELLKKGVFIIFLSTDLVFDGFQPFPAAEDQLNPVNEYARQKREIEAFLAPHMHQAAIVRLGKVLFSDHPLFMSWINQLQNGMMIAPFHDQRFAPICIDFALQVLMQIGTCRHNGIWHASSRDDISYSQAIYYVAAKLNLPIDLIHPVESTHAGVGNEKTHVALNSAELRELGISAPSAHETLDRCFQTRTTFLN